VLGNLPAAPAQALGPQPGCPWPFHLDANTTNVAFPDQNANYYTLAVPSAGIDSLTITGRFPHTRYMSFTSYTGQTQAVDGINDVHIIPASGNLADNPFIAGHARNTSGALRDYTVTVLKGQKPAIPAPNTIYTTDTDGTHSNLSSFIVIYRTYRPDAAYPNDGGGGEPLPTVTANLTGGGTMAIGDPSACSTAPDQDLGVNGALTDTTLPTLLPGPAQCYPGLDPPAWHRYTNVATAEVQGTNNTCLMDNNPQNSITGPLDMTIPPGGFLENPDNKYIAAILNVDNFPTPGQPNVLVVHSRVPTTPDTFHNTAVMPSGQLRYWSMCSNEGLTTRFYACIMDDGLARLTPVGDYCLVVSRTSDRPRNANIAHDVNWLPFGALHDNVLIERNMLPDPGFVPAIQNVAPGNEQAGLGAYFPSSAYMTVADFEKQGCPGFATTTAFGTRPGDLPNTTLPNTSGRALDIAFPWLLAPALGGPLALLLVRGRRQTESNGRG
jgi:hypothetical protein